MDLLEALGDPGTRVLDFRPIPAFLGGHVPGSIHLPEPPDTASGLPDGLARGLAAELAGMTRWILLHPLLPPGPGLLATWCGAGHRLHTIGEITPFEVEDLRAVGEVELVDAGGPTPLQVKARPRVPVAVVGATLPIRALAASLLLRRGTPDVLVLVD
ncbi:MAG: rhodanese-like domain-containing protein [Gemmatimonadales bacterium]|nr:MAG: rhodanese-like domain-containing protein [Gemmatimonadales bacterium]